MGRWPKPRIVEDDGMVLDNVTTGWESLARRVWTMWVTGKKPPGDLEASWRNEMIIARLADPAAIVEGRGIVWSRALEEGGDDG